MTTSQAVWFLVLMTFALIAMSLLLVFVGAAINNSESRLPERRNQSTVDGGMAGPDFF